MSDTDDTDDLLLIPPDFFTVKSDNEDSLHLYAPYYSVVHNLISQVHSLEGRINYIETHSDNTSLMNSSLNSTDFMPDVRRFNSLDELSKPLVAYPGSTQSTPQKPRNRTKQNSLPSTPNVDVIKRRPVRSRYGRSTNSKYNSPQSQTAVDLAEIQNFIAHVKTIQKHDVARNLNQSFEKIGQSNAVKDQESIRDANVKMLWERGSVCSKPISIASSISEPVTKSEKLWKVGDTKFSVPDRGMGMRDTLYSDKNLQDSSLSSLGSQPPSSSDILSSAHNSVSAFSDNAPLSLSSSDSTQLTTVQKDINARLDKLHLNALEILDKHENSSGDVKSLADNASKARKPEEQRKLVLMSLSELWNQDVGAGDYNGREYSKFSNKLQEEKLRRQHCEELIHHLQAKNLELQERIAVAVQVDDAKDDAILKVHKSWEEAAAKIDNLHKDKACLEVKIAEINSRMTNELLEASKKVTHYEGESSKALNLAHTSQEKVAALEKQNTNLQAEIQSYSDRLKKLEMDFEREHGNNLQLSKILSQKEIELNENKNVQAQATKEIAQSKRAVEICQAELTSIKTKQTQFETKYNETLLQVKDLDADKKKLLTSIENYKKTEKTLKDELVQINETNEQSKNDLRTFYQNQVEILVREKLKEFQQQLEKAQNTLHEEMRARELSVAKNAASHLQQINEKNMLEIHLLEEKHKEEMKLYKLQSFQLQQEINNLQMKFQQQQERRAHTVQQLQKVMEAQWAEALKIINNGKSPVVAEDKSTNTIDQLNHLKSRSYNNLEEILFRENGNNIGKNLPTHKGSGAPSVRLFESVSMNSTLENSDTRLMETPLTSRPEKNKQQMDNEFQRYVQMLLNKQPENSIDDQPLKQEGYENQQQADNTKSYRYRDRLGKPPWK